VDDSRSGELVSLIHVRSITHLIQGEAMCIDGEQCDTSKTGSTKTSGCMLNGNNAMTAI